MQIFIDTADIEEIKQAQAMGVLDGVTTNPSLVAKTGKEFEPCIKEILEVVPGPVSVEVVATDFEGMMKEAGTYSAWGDNVVIKVPIIKEGLKAIKALSDEGHQGQRDPVLLPHAGPVGRQGRGGLYQPLCGPLDDISSDGMELIRQIVEIYANYAYDTEVLVASVRNPLHVVQSAFIGADVATIPLKVIDQLLKHPLTDKGLAGFLADWEKMNK
jgi:transaldolase